MKKRYLLLPLAIALAAVGSTHAQGLPCTNPINTFPYNENFDSGPAGWVVQNYNPTVAASWALGTPSKNVINSAFSGANSWVTGLSAQYLDAENNAVVSPCFDFSSLALPIVEMKVWWDSEFSWDGVVLQSSINGGATWQNVGAMGDPNNWYNDNTIGGNPGGQPEGWTGGGTNGSGGWVTVKHNLTGLQNQPNVRLRLAFGSDGSVHTYDGFAFDNFQIYQPSAIDVGVATVTSPVTGTVCSPGPFNVTVQIQNYGSATQSNIPVSYSVNGGAPVTETFAGPLAPGASAAFTFATAFTAPGNGSYAFNATTTLAGDGNATNDGAAGGTMTVVTPITVTSTTPYVEDFNTTNGGWSSGGTNSSWALGRPNKTTIVLPAGNRAWVTGRTANYNDNEQSYVISPCFDFSGLTRPTLEMKIWWESAPADGAALQATTDGGLTWQTIGNAGDPDNWYTSSFVTGTPGGQPQGWAGQGLAGSGGMVIARHAMPSLAGQSSVRLRIVFGSDGFTNTDGFAFDDMRIYQPAPNDVGVSAIISPVASTSCALGTPVSVTIRVRNHGTLPQSNIPVSYSINGGQAGTGTIAGPLAPGATATFTFSAPFTPAAAGSYSFTATTSLAGDADASNDAAGPVVYQITQPIVVTPTQPYDENFDNGPGGWSSGGTASTWALGTPAKPVINSAYSGPNSWVTNLTGDYNSSENSYVMSPCLNFSTLGNPTITMQIWWNSEFSWDGAVLQSSIDGGTTWQTIGNVGDPDNWYNDGSINGNPGGQSNGWSGRNSSGNGSSGWVLARHEMPQLSRQSSVRLRIAFGSDGTANDDGFAFDDIHIEGIVPPPPPPPNDLGVTAIVQPSSSCALTSTELVTVLVKNYGTAPQSNFQVKVNFSGTASGTRTTTVTGPVPGGVTVPVLFTRTIDLTARGCYDFKAYTTLATDTMPANDTARVQVCNLLLNVSPTQPYQQDFENGEAGWSPAGGSWAYGTPAKNVIQGAASGTKAWVTGGLHTGRYGASEVSSLESPCFNLSGLSDPVVELKIWYRTEAGRDGASLQYTADNGLTWQTIGAAGDSNNWYNSGSIIAQPGGTPHGWTGSSGGYVLARHEVTSLANLPQVRFRLAFSATSANPPAGNDVDDGIAFDDFAIYQKPDRDIAVLGLLPLGTACGYGSSEQIQMRVKNLGTQPAANFPVSYKLDGNAPVIATVTQTLAPGQELIVPFQQRVNLSVNPCYTLVLSANLPNDQAPFNNSLTLQLCNGQSNVVPIVPIDFETATTSTSRMTLQARARSGFAVQSGRGTSGSIGLVIDGASGNWTDPIGPTANPWTMNSDHLATATLCVNPSSVNPGAPIQLSFDLKQISTGTAGLFSNVNFRVLVNGTVVGQSNYQPSITSPGSGSFTNYMFDITSFRTPGSNITIQFQSSVNRGFSGTQGDANILDNINVTGVVGLPAESAFAQGVNVFPNPSTGVFNVSLKHEGTHAYTMSVTDLSGRLVRQKQFTSRGYVETAVDLTTLPRGLYVLRITDANGNQSVRKLTLE